MQGAWWFGSRLLELGLDQANQWCQWCHENRGESSSDDPLHGIWTCPRWRLEDTAPAIKASQALVAEATEGADLHPIFWFRGLVPKGWTKTLLAGWEPSFETMSGGCLEEATSTEPHVMHEGDIMATDGSGGRYPTNTTLRRVGWGALHSQKRRPAHWMGQGWHSW